MSRRVGTVAIWDGPTIEVSYQTESIPASVRLAIYLSDAQHDYLVAFMHRDQAVEVAKALTEAVRRLEVSNMLDAIRKGRAASPRRVATCLSTQ